MATARKPRLIDEIGDDRIDAPEGFAPAAETLAQAFAGTSDAARQAAETGRRLQEDAMQFWQQRFQSNTEAASHLMKCKTLPEVFETQQAWVKTASEQYTAYLTQMFATMQSAWGKTGK